MNTDTSAEKKAPRQRIGLIAGGGRFPIIFSKAARTKGYSVVAAAYRKEADQQLKEYVDAIEWVYLGQINRLIKFFRKHRVDQTVMMGTIKKTRIFTDVRPDIKAISLVAGMKSTHDDGILRKFADFLTSEGIRILPSTFLLPELLASEGCWTKRKPSLSETADIEFGLPLARMIGRMDIGQCIVVGGGSVLAVEAVDGTDATIRRGGALGNGHAIVIKICKPGQDERFDIPAVGEQTIEVMHESKASVLVIEAQKAVVFEREMMIRLADRYGIAVVAVKTEPEVNEI